MENRNNLSAETNSGKNAEEVAEYTIESYGNGAHYKVINFDNPKYAPKQGLVVLTPLKVAKALARPDGVSAFRHINEASFKVITDRKTGYKIGVPIGRDKDSQIVWKKIVVTGEETIDLSMPDQRIRWICIKNGPFFQGSPNFNSGSKTVYAAVDKEAEASMFKANRRTRVKAAEIAASLYGEELKDYGVALGFVDPNLMSEDTLSMNVIKFVENETRDPRTRKTGAEVFMDFHNSDTRVELIILKRALSAGILTENPVDKSINYNGMPIGHSEMEAVQYLKSHPVTLTSIDVQARKIAGGSTTVTSRVNAPKDEKDAVIERQRMEMESLKAQLANISEKAVEMQSEAVLVEEHPEYARLLSEAKQLNIKGPHLVGKNDPIGVRIKKLEKKIEEHKRSLNN